jgi:hypothetical protein
MRRGEVVFDEFQSVSKAQFQQHPHQNPVPFTPNVDLQDAEGHLSSIYKIAGACSKVRDQNRNGATPVVQYIWIDTICIEKTGKENTREFKIAISMDKAS